MPLPSIAADIPLDQAGQTGGPTPAATPPLSFFDQVKLGYKQAYAEPNWGSNQHSYESEAYHDISTALAQRGYKGVIDRSFSILSPEMDNEADFYAVGYHPERPWLSAPGARSRFDALWKAFNAERQADPNFLPAYKDVHDFGTLLDHIKAKRLGDMNDVVTRAPDGVGFVPGLVGSLGRAATDPLSYLPVGGPASDAATFGGRILAHALTGAAINAGVTVASEPFVRMDAANLGVQRTTGDFLTDLLSSTAFGAGLGGTVGAIGEGIHALKASPEPAAPPEAAPQPATPPPEAKGTPFEGFDEKVAKAFSEIVPREQRTPDEQAAMDAIQRNAEVKATSPFVPGPAGDDAHASSLDRGMAALSGAPTRVPKGQAVVRESIETPDDVSGARFPARELLKAKIHQVEAPHGGANLAGGAAFGPYQFEPRTWVNLFKRRYPNDPRSFDQIAALRGDPHLNDVLMNDLLSENAAALRHAGFEENAGNLYLAHVLGHDRAVHVLAADPNAKLGDILPENYFTHGNPFKPTDSAASLVHWAYRKMGDDGSLPVHIASAPDAPAGADAIEAAATGPESVIPTGANDVEALYGDVGMADRPVLKPELFDSPETHAAAQLRFERSSDLADGFTPVLSRAEAFSPYEHFNALRRYQGTVTAEAIGERLGITPEEAVKAVQTMQSLDRRSPFILARERNAEPGALPTRIMRRPKLPPQSLIQFLAAKGGIMDRNAKLGIGGGDLRAMDADVGRKFRKPLINNESGMGLDDALTLATEAGYFPELGADTYHSKPDTQILLDAIDAELRGERKLPVEDQLAAHEAALRARYGEGPPEPVAPEQPPRMTLEDIASHDIAPEDLATIHRLAEGQGVPLSDEEAIEVYHRFLNGQDLHDAIGDTIRAAAARELEQYAALTGEMGYGDASHEWEIYTGEHPQVFDYGEPDFGDGTGDGRSAPAEGGASASRAALAAIAHDPEKREFGDPVGKAAEAQAESLGHDLEMMLAHGDDTRGRGFILHGARDEVPQLTEGYYNPDNIYGGFDTFYTTDAADIAKGYKRKRPNGRIYQVKERHPIRMFDMERPISAEEVDRLFHNDDLAGMAFEEATYENGGKANLREVMDYMRAMSAGEGISKDEVQEIFDTAIQTLKSDGYGGMSHTGGLRTNRQPHAVRIYFDAPTQIDLREVRASHPPAMSAGDFHTAEAAETYRLDEEGGEQDVGSILSDIAEEEKSIDEMRNCLKPKGPAE